MLIICGNCNLRNNVSEVQDLKDVEKFTDRSILISRCKSCGTVTIQLIEVRKEDDKLFVDTAFGLKAQNILKREAKRLKVKQIQPDETRLNGWVYGLNRERKNKYGKVTSVRQYACDYKTDKTKIEKTINLK